MRFRIVLSLLLLVACGPLPQADDEPARANGIGTSPSAQKAEAPDAGS